MYRKPAKYLIYEYKKKEQGHICDIRCIPILHYAILSDFNRSVTDGPMDGQFNGRMDGNTLL